MNIPDYFSPIVGYRVWQWDAAGLRSLNNEPWRPGQPMVAGCRASSVATHDPHDAPQANCTCGVYAAKNLEHLPTTGYWQYGIHGEVDLWGTVVEHELGWRAQFAYPKNLYLPPDALPFTLAKIQSRLKMLTTYRAEIFVADPQGNIPLWANESGYDPAGLDYLIETRKNYYIRCREQRTLKRGDRVAILGRGIAVAEQVDDNQVHAVLWNRSVVRIGRKQIVWDEFNMRWEANYSGVFQTRPAADCANFFMIRLLSSEFPGHRLHLNRLSGFN